MGRRRVANCASCVTLSGGNLPSSVTGSTDASGNVTFSNVPAGSGYTVTVVKNGQTGTSSGLTVTNGSTTNVTVTMPTGTITPTVTWAGKAITGATVTISGGPNSPTTYSGTTNASGRSPSPSRPRPQLPVHGLRRRRTTAPAAPP